MIFPMMNAQEKISVALCTYNGERFLSRQLTSMRQQTRLPDELVVCDDCSTDNTAEILQDFAASAGFPVKISRNERNLGFVANFERAILFCQGDLIALSDQDDIWDPMRLQRSEEEFLAHPEVGLGFFRCRHHRRSGSADRNTIVAKLRLRGRAEAASPRRRLHRSGQEPFRDGSNGHVSEPHAPELSAHRAGWFHDEWIAATAASVSDLMPIESPLIRYRRHASQQVGLGPAPSLRRGINSTGASCPGK